MHNLSSQNGHCVSFVSLICTNSVRCINQILELWSTVMGCNPAGFVAQQVLFVLERDARGPKSSSECVFQVMDSDIGNSARFLAFFHARPMIR
jgi:hypothetical protein